MKIGINLYGILHNRRDTLTALKELRELGFSSVEPCVAPGVIPGMEHVFWPADWLKAHAEEIRSLGLEVFSAHLVGWNPATQREELKELAVTCGIRHFVVKSPQVLTETTLHETALAYTMLAETLETAGAEVLIHNEQDDIAAHFAGKTAYERLIDLCMGKVGAQVDAGWVLAGGEDPETMKKGVGVIVNETERLSQMVEELLDFSRMQNGHFTLKSANMDILAELGDAVLIYSDKARREQINIIYNDPEMLPFVFGDKNRIRQVFINIIDNAVKYSSAGDTVTINASENGGEVIVSVSDTGCGIKKSDLSKVKTKFYKANHTRRGSGIGLAVADEIVSMHGGSMNITSAGEGKGTTVTIKLPAIQS